MLEITQRYGKSLSPDGLRAEGAPKWIDEIDNPYIQGLFAPTDQEVVANQLNVIEGEIPKDLYGGYFRNGPNNYFAPLNRYHWFDGDGMVHGVWFENGEARYANRWIDTRGLEREKRNGEAIYPGVLGPFDFSLEGGPLKDTANTDLLTFNGRLLATWYESGQPYAINPETLETIGVETFDGKLDSKISAHSKVDPSNGDLVFFSYGDRPPYMQYGVVRPNGEVHHVEIEIPGPRRPHDIGITESYSILHDFPVFVNEEFFKKTGKRVPLFHPNVATRYGVIPRFGAGDSIRWFEFEPCYMLHVVNCWEEGDWVTMIGCRTDDPSLDPDPRDGKIAAMLSFLKLQANLYEWKMNLKTGETNERKLDDLNAEFPRIAASAVGRQNRFSYHQQIPHEVPATFDALVRYDLSDGSRKQWNYGEGVYGSEAPFAPRQNSKGEDDGYVLSITTDTRNWTSACEIFDAAQIEQGPVAKVALPIRVPAGFHGTWMPGEFIGS